MPDRVGTRNVPGHNPQQALHLGTRHTKLDQVAPYFFFFFFFYLWETHPHIHNDKVIRVMRLTSSKCREQDISNLVENGEKKEELSELDLEGKTWV